MTSTIKVNTIQDAGGRVHETFSFVCRFTMITTPATVGTTVNTSSITDNGTGDATLGITNSYSDALYNCQVTGNNNKSSSGAMAFGPYGTDWNNSANGLTTSTARISQRFTNSSTVADTDVDVTCVGLIGGLA